MPAAVSKNLLNPYYETWCRLQVNPEAFEYMYNGRRSRLWSDPLLRADLIKSVARWPLIHRYGFAIPSEEALQAIAALSPIVEIGAGAGYWAWMLKERGATIQAFDPRPVLGNHYRFTNYYSPIAKGDYRRALKMYPDRTLFVSWPSYSQNWAAQALRLHKGQYVAYIALLDYGFKEKQFIELPQWDGIHDNLWIYEKIPGIDVETLDASFICQQCQGKVWHGDGWCNNCFRYVEELPA